MFNLEDIRIKVLNEASKDTRGIVTPDMFNNALKFAEISVLAERLGLPEGYLPGKATGQEAYPFTSKIEDDVRPYLKSIELTLDINGRSPLPPDYLRRSSIDAEYKFIESKPQLTGLDCAESEVKTTTEKTRNVNVKFFSIKTIQ